jgi:hypothetical protein
MVRENVRRRRTGDRHLSCRPRPTASPTCCCRPRSRAASSTTAPASTRSSATWTRRTSRASRSACAPMPRPPALWIRGILQHEYGVDLDKVTWMTVGDGHLAEYRIPQLRAPAQGLGHRPDDAGRRTGRDAAGRDMPKDPRVQRLVPNPHQAAKDWFAREGVVPINHMFVVHEDLSQAAPGRRCARSIRMIVESRALTEGGRRRSSRRSAWRRTARACSWRSTGRYEQKIIPRRLSSTSCSTTPRRR